MLAQTEYSALVFGDTHQTMWKLEGSCIPSVIPVYALQTGICRISKAKIV